MVFSYRFASGENLLSAQFRVFQQNRPIAAVPHIRAKRTMARIGGLAWVCFAEPRPSACNRPIADGDEVRQKPDRMY
jgi:hypothetical protein